MNIPDTTTCPDALSSYRQRDDEIVLEAEEERLSESFFSIIYDEKEDRLTDLISDLLTENTRFQNLVLSHLAKMFLDTFGPYPRRSQKPNPISTQINNSVNKAAKAFINLNLQGHSND